MITRSSLQCWLDSLEARRGYETAAPPEHHWLRQPALADLHRDLDALIDPSSEDVASRIEALFADHGWIDAWFEAMALEAGRNRFFCPPLAPLNTGLQRGVLIFVHDRVRITLGVMPIEEFAARKATRRDNSSITFSGGLSVQKFLRAGGAVLTMWHANAVDDTFGFAAHRMRCRPGVRRRLEDGSTIRLDGRRDSYIVEHAASDLLILQAEILVDQAALLVEYDAHTLAPVAASDTDEASSRSQMLLSIMRRIGRRADAAVLLRYTEDERFHLRWHAMLELLSMAPTLALSRLAAMASGDPHPEVREAAGIALASLQTPAKDAAPCPA